MASKRLYGIQCLRARRLVEAGVRFVEVTCPPGASNGAWDQHGDLKKGHEKNALDTDQAIAGLLKDLKSRGLLDETLVVWAGEFGRTPHSAGRDGRDHHPEGFSVWLAGGGVKGGTIYGATDELGMHAVEDIVTMHDLHATILHLLGLDHERLTYRFGGRDFRLTDVHGRVVRRSSPDGDGPRASASRNGHEFRARHIREAKTPQDHRACGVHASRTGRIMEKPPLGLEPRTCSLRMSCSTS